MKSLLTIAAVLAALLSGTVAAQQWTLYTPPEGDFRVLLPAPPKRLDLPGSSIEYRTEVDDLHFSVFRHAPARLQRGLQPREDIIERLYSIHDQYVRDIGENEGDLAGDEYMFRFGAMRSMHKVIHDGGRYYELMVQSTGDDGLPKETARDFFKSFAATSSPQASVAAALPGPDSCQGRSNALSRRFCEYLTCLVPANQAHPVCASLPKLFRN